MKILRIVTAFLFVLSLALYAGVTFRYRVVLDRVSPRIQCDSEVLEVSVNATDDQLLAGVTATDNRDGDLTDRIMIQGISRLLTTDTARITYVVMDSSDNLASCTRTLRYTDYERPRLILTEIPVYRTFPTGNALSDLLSTLTVTDVRDGDISDQVHILAPTNMDISLENTHTLTIEVYNSMGDAEIVPLTVVIDNEGAQTPLVTLKEYITYVDAGSRFDPKACIRTLNGSSYTGSDAGLRIDSNVDSDVPGVYQVCYQYQDFTVYQTVVVR